MLKSAVCHYSNNMIQLDYLIDSNPRGGRNHIVFNKEYRESAYKLRDEWQKSTLDHRMIGLLLGYREDVVEAFCKRIGRR